MKSDLYPRYSIVWKYTIESKNKAEFEFEYGQNGTWNKLFRESEDYLGSFLHKSEEETTIYLLIDTWRNKESYMSFMKLYEEKYNEISFGFKHFYLIEEKIGAYSSVL